GFKERRLESLKIGPFEIPVDDNAATLIPYRSGKPSFQYVSLADMLKDRVPPGALKDKIVLVGATASALEDLRATPIDSVLPGVEVHANMIAGMLDQEFKRRPWFTYGAEATLLLLGGVALAVLIPLLTAFWATVAVAVGSAAIIALNVAMWQVNDFVLPLASSILMVLALYTMIMAFWGAPMGDPQQARNAVLAALDMQKAVGPLNQRFTARGWAELRIGIGVNSGTVRVGDMGSKVRRAYTAMGDPVNAASRLEGLTKHYGVGILIGVSTLRMVEDIAFREVDRVKVKGKDEAITVYEPPGLAAELDPATQEELRLWGQALRAY